MKRENNDGFWSGVEKGLTWAAIIYLGLSLFDSFMRWGMKGKTQAWVFWSFMGSIFSSVVIVCGLGLLDGICEYLLNVDLTFMDENWFPYAYLGASVFSGMVWAALFPVDGKRGAAAPALAVCVIGLIVLAVVVWLLWLFVSVFLKSTEGFALGWKLFYASFAIIPAACIGIWSKCGKFIKAVVGRLIVGGMVLGLLYSIVIQSENRPSYETQIVVNPNAVSMAELKKLHRAGIKLPWEYHAATVSPAR